MLAAALEAEVNQCVAELAAETDVPDAAWWSATTVAGPAVTTAAGPVEVMAPRMNEKRVDAATGERMRLSSKTLPPWCRKSPNVSEVLPLLYLHGLSAEDFVPALERFLGSAAGLSAAIVTRLTRQWSDHHTAFQQRVLADSDYVCVCGRTGCTPRSGSGRRTPASWC